MLDCDEVLVGSEVIDIAAELDLLAHLGLAHQREYYVTRFVGLSNADFDAELRSDYAGLTGDERPSDFWSQLAQTIWPRIEAEHEAIDGDADLVRAFRGKVAVG